MASAVVGAGVRLPAARSLAELYTCVSLGRPLQGRPEGFWAPFTDLDAVEAPVARCAEPPDAAGRATRLRKVPRESRLAAAAAHEALADRAPSSVQATWPVERTAGDLGTVGTVWVSSTAGLAEYGQVCVDAATLDPGLVSPLAGPQSAYNGPAATVSIQFGLTGPQLTLTGGYEAGATALVEAARLLDEDRCDHVLVGGSATVSRWRLVGAGPDTVPAEGAVCLLLGRRGPVAANPLRRGRIGESTLARFVTGCLAEMSRPPQAVALATAAPWRAPLRRAMRAAGVSVQATWPVERTAGDLGAANGLQAVLAAVAACGWPASGLSSVLVLAVGDAGDAVAVEVLSRKGPLA
jgi:3-oxoacyl-[acyl-carrier-protein] synthase II